MDIRQAVFYEKSSAVVATGYPFVYQHLTGDGAGLYSPAVEWHAIRAHYERLFADAKRRGETQGTIAERGGIRQNDISRLLDNDKAGPYVAKFIKAIQGLGFKPSEFFALLESGGKRPLQTGATRADNPTREGDQDAEPGAAVRSEPFVVLSRQQIRDIGRAIVDTFLEAQGAAETHRQVAGDRPRRPTNTTPRRRARR